MFCHACTAPEWGLQASLKVTLGIGFGVGERQMLQFVTAISCCPHRWKFVLVYFHCLYQFLLIFTGSSLSLLFSLSSSLFNCWSGWPIVIAGLKLDEEARVYICHSDCSHSYVKSNPCNKLFCLITHPESSAWSNHNWSILPIPEFIVKAFNIRPEFRELFLPAH